MKDNILETIHNYKIIWFLNYLKTNNLDLCDVDDYFIGRYLTKNDIKHLNELVKELGEYCITNYLIADDNSKSTQRINFLLNDMRSNNLKLSSVDEKYLKRRLRKNDIKRLHKFVYELGKLEIMKFVPEQSIDVGNEISQDFNLEWTEVNPYKILGIEEGEYSKEELLAIIENKINFINAHEIDEEKRKNDIELVLDAYNELVNDTISRK